MTHNNMLSIRAAQHDRLIEMLNFNIPTSDPNRPIWKIFIMDQMGQRIVSPILKVNDLREEGVTLFFQLNSPVQRDRIPGVPAIYFIEPTNENLYKLSQDFKLKLYDYYYINFTSYVNRDQLEELAQIALETGSQAQISKIYDQYLNYISLEDNLFTLDIPNVFTSSKNYNEKLVEKISNGLFSTLMSFNDSKTTGASLPVPVLCTLKDNKEDLVSSSSLSSDDLAESIRIKLESRIKNHLINTKSMQNTQQSTPVTRQQRPLLILLNRSIDLASPLKHSSAYNALIDDILGITMNCIKISTKSYDIDRRDWLWRENACKPFPSVAECVENSLKSYKSDYDKIIQTTPGITEDMILNNNSGSNTTTTSSGAALSPDQLKVAINVLPELTERKRLIDSHLQISTTLLEEIKSRDLGNLFHLEEELSQLNQQSLQAALSNQKLGNPRDKLRLLIIFYIYNSEKTSNLDALKIFCKKAVGEIKNLTEIDMKAFKFVIDGPEHEGQDKKDNKTAAGKDNEKDIKSVDAMTTATSGSGGDITTDFFSKLSLGNLVSSVKSLKALLRSSETSDSKVTKIIDMAYAQATTGSINSSSSSASRYQPHQSNLGPSSLISSFTTTVTSPITSPTSTGGLSINLSDPRPLKSSSSQSQQQSTYSIDHVIVFFVGGLTYSEYDNLSEHFVKNRALQNVSFTIGTTEMFNANTFINQLAAKT